MIVHQGGECVYSGVFGKRSAMGEPAVRGLLYRAASMTKPVTTAAVLQLVDKGLLSLEDNISSFYPVAANFKVAVVENDTIASLAPLKKAIKVGNLLSHTSGIGCDPIWSLLPCANNKLRLREAIEDILSKPLSFEPDSSESYSTTEAFDLAAGIVEMISDRPFDEYLKKNIFEPLGMTNTTFSPTDAQWKNTVAMHERTEKGDSADHAMPHGCVFESFLPERMAAGAGLVTTADDYISFADMLCFGGKTRDGKQVLSENAVKAMSTPQYNKGFGYDNWGLGVRVITRKDPNGLGVGCFGWSGAYGTHFWVDRENGISVVMMKNSCYDGGAGNQSACQLEKDVYDSLQSCE